MFSFYLTRGYKLDYLINISNLEKHILYHAMNKYYKELSIMLGGEGDS